MSRNTGLRIISALVLIAAIAGIAFFAYQSGVAHGSPVILEGPSGQSVTAPYPYPYYGMPFRPWGFGFGCFGILIPLFLFFLAFSAFRFLLWGPRWGWRHHHHGPWGREWNGDAPPMFDEWHKRAHGEEPPSEKKE